MSLAKIALRRLDKEVAKAVGNKKISLIRTSLFGTPAARKGLRDGKINRLTNTMAEKGNIPKEQSKNYDKFLNRKYDDAKHALRKGSNSKGYKKPISERLEDYTDKKERLSRRKGTKVSGKKDDTWGGNVKSSGVGKEDNVVINHGGGKHYLEHMLKTKNKSMGYKLEGDRGTGVQVHPMTKKYKNYKAESSDRINYYSTKAGKYGDVPAKLTGKIKSKYLTRANNDYEAGIKTENLKHLRHPRVKETGAKPDQFYVTGKGGKVDDKILEKMKNNTLDGSNIKKEVASAKLGSEKKKSRKSPSNSQKEVKKINKRVRERGSLENMNSRERYVYGKAAIISGSKYPATRNHDLRKFVDASSKKSATIHSKIGEGTNSKIKSRLADFKKTKKKEHKAKELFSESNQKKDTQVTHPVGNDKNNKGSLVVREGDKKASPNGTPNSKKEKSTNNRNLALGLGGAATALTAGGLYAASRKNKEETKEKGLAAA